MVDFARLATEKPNPRSRNLDLLSTARLVALINREDKKTIEAVGRARPAIVKAVNLIAASFEKKGRLFLCGAGTSGRLCVLEAAECPPTFNTWPGQVQALMAGGMAAVFQSKEGAEDNAALARSAMRRQVKRGDVVVGVAASGVTPFTLASLTTGRSRGAKTILISCNPLPGHRRLADVVIPLRTGPEVLSGSTRLKAGTATKMVLNILTTASMVRVGKVYGNWMVDLQPKSKKLVARGLRLIQRLGGVSEKEAGKLFKKAGRSVKLAVVMARLNLPVPAARAVLERHSGSLRKALGE